jgi:hypothetical protein
MVTYSNLQTRTRRLAAGLLWVAIFAGLIACAKDPDTSWWSLRPIQKTTSPSLPSKYAEWAKTPIDHFILAKLAEKQLTPSRRADKRTLLRRVYFDLAGLPPSPADIDEFLSDSSPDAFAKVVERLLASPRYGERWARHWLDVVHYAETHGHDQDRPRTNSWPYRDYVIQSFNSDKPYARFVQEQIAGDMLFPEDPQATVALGFLATGPWDESSLRDIREDSIDRQIARYLDRDDIVATVMNTFVSATVQCARCHDHKFDPISQKEYYNLQAVFAATDKADRSFDEKPEIHRKRQDLVRQRRAIERRDPALLATLESSELRDQVRAWEESLREKAGAWTVLKPDTATSSNGAKLTLQSDHSILSSGTRPETETYHVRAKAPLHGITAVRLEVLTDDSLPKKGPGRQDNGNLHLTDFRIEAVTQSGTSRLKIAKAAADFDQKDWEISKAIDSDPKTAWGIYPEVSKPHLAVFELNSPLSTSALLFSLEQQHGGGHLIGRFRLSVTTSAPPVSIFQLPQNVAQIFDVPAPGRTREQNVELALGYLRQKIDAELAVLPPPRLVYAGASDFVPDGSFKPALAPRSIQMLKRGDIQQAGELAKPGALRCVRNLDSEFASGDDEGARRAELAHWITNPDNPLAWRSIVNRVWHYHFGRALVDTPNDFGHMGSMPSHPELLDWLAQTFRESGGSLKALHRLIIYSSAYQQSSAHNSQNAQIDSGNVYLWRMNRTRLDAESLRDAALVLSDRIDFAMGGPSVQQFLMSPGIHVTPNVDYAKFDVDSRASCRRSIYRFIFRTLPDPFMDSLDCADASQLTPARNTSVTVLQALAMLNDQFLVRYSEHFAARLERYSSVLPEQIQFACEFAWGRPPTAAELREFGLYAQAHGMANFCRVLLNSNEFMFVQ